MTFNLAIDERQLEVFCQKHHIRQMALFGSILGNEFGPESDIDVLVTFEPNITLGLIGFAAIEIELSELLGRQVDLNTAQDLSRHFREEVLSLAQVIYER